MHRSISNIFFIYNVQRISYQNSYNETKKTSKSYVGQTTEPPFNLVLRLRNIEYFFRFILLDCVNISLLFCQFFQPGYSWKATVSWLYESGLTMVSYTGIVWYICNCTTFIIKKCAWVIFQPVKVHSLQSGRKFSGPAELLWNWSGGGRRGGGDRGLTSDSKWGAENTFFSVTL